MYCVAEKSRKNTTLTYSIITLNCCFGEHVNKQFIYTSSRKILLKFKKGRSKALFMLKNLYSDGFLHGVVLKNIDTRRIDLWHSFLQGHATKEHRHHMLFELPSSPDILFDKKKKNPLESCLMTVSLMFTLFAPFVVSTNSAAAKGVYRWFTRADSSVFNKTQNEFTLWTTPCIYVIWPIVSVETLISAALKFVRFEKTV